MTTRVAVLAVVAAGAAMLVGLFVADLEGDPVITDTPVYQTYGRLVEDGRVPYRDFRVEYPPGALVPFVLPSLVTSTPTGYDGAFQALMILSLAGASALIVFSLAALGTSTARIGLSLGCFWGGLALLGPFLMTRFDLFAATVTLGAVCAILYRRKHLGPVVLGLAIATKIYPAVLVPLLAARAARSGGARAAVQATALCVGSAVLVYLPFALLAPEGVVRSVWRQLARPLQIESFGSGALLALHHAFGMPLGWASGSGSQNLTGTVASVAAWLTTVVGIAALIFVWVRFARGDSGDDGRFVRYAAAATVAFVAFGKVLSPQFLVWMLAAVVLVPGRRGVSAMALLVAACALTRLWFPRTYWLLVREFDPTSSWLVLARDVLLVSVFVALVVRFAGVRARTRSSAASHNVRQEIASL